MQILANLLTGVGVVLVIIAMLSGFASLQSLLERTRSGPGLLFADVEILGIIALSSAALGTAALFLGKKLKKQRSGSS